jgi:hypothetical protein
LLLHRFYCHPMIGSSVVTVSSLSHNCSSARAHQTTYVLS